MDSKKKKVIIIFFVPASLMAILFILFSFISGGLSIWLLLMTSFWIVFLAAVWKKIQSSAFILSQSIIFLALLFFASLIFLGISLPDKARDVELKYGIDREKLLK